MKGEAMLDEEKNKLELTVCMGRQRSMCCPVGERGPYPVRSDNIDTTAPPHQYHGIAFGQHIRSCRTARGLTQGQVAGRSGISTCTIRRAELGGTLSVDSLARVVVAGLQMPLSTFFESFESFESREDDTSQDIQLTLLSMTDRQRNMAIHLIRAAIEFTNGQSD